MRNKTSEEVKQENSIKRKLNSNGQQFYQYQQNKQSPLIPTELTEHR